MDDIKLPPKSTPARYLTSKEQRTQDTINKSLNAPTVSFGNVNQLSSFLAEENVKEFNTIMYARAFSFNTHAVEDREACIRECVEYFNLCNKYNMIPTISSLCVYIGLSTTQLYGNISNPNCEYKDVLSEAVKVCHMVNENGALAGKIPVTLFQFLSTNYYGLKNTQEVSIKPINTGEVDNQETLKVIEEQLAKEQNVD